MNIYEELKTAYGIQFENLFSRLMKEKYGMQYQPTSTYGNIGDLSVDGVLNLNVAFAVYAPEIYNDKNAIQKIKSDFHGFIKQREKGNWQYIQKYIFVIKRDREGITSSVLNWITQFNDTFPVGLMTLNDLVLLANGYLPFSDDGRLLLEFKNDVTKVMEYIIATDFTAEPICMSLSDNIKLNILVKWNMKQNTFNSEKLELLKSKILNALSNICTYLTPIYVHALSNGFLLFNNDSLEAGERLRNEMQPQTYKIRCEISNLLNELYTKNS